MCGCGCVLGELVCGCVMGANVCFGSESVCGSGCILG